MIPPELLMQTALEEAQAAAQRGEVPIGAAIADATGHIIARAGNRVEETGNPLAHAEMLVLNQALQTHGPYLTGCTLAVTLEPCAMCAQAICWSRVETLVYGAYDPKSGGTDNGARVPYHTHHMPTILGGIHEDACADLLKSFFETKR